MLADQGKRLRILFQPKDELVQCGLHLGPRPIIADAVAQAVLAPQGKLKAIAAVIPLYFAGL